MTAKVSGKSQPIQCQPNKMVLHTQNDHYMGLALRGSKARFSLVNYTSSSSGDYAEVTGVVIIFLL